MRETWKKLNNKEKEYNCLAKGYAFSGGIKNSVSTLKAKKKKF